jgi:hypothetical protein
MVKVVYPETTRTYYIVYVPVSYEQHENALPAALAKLAKKHTKVKHDGGGMALGSGVYDHNFISYGAADARAFAAAARGLGYKPRLLRFEDR